MLWKIMLEWWKMGHGELKFWNFNMKSHLHLHLLLASKFRFYFGVYFWLQKCTPKEGKWGERHGSGSKGWHCLWNLHWHLHLLCICICFFFDVLVFLSYVWHLVCGRIYHACGDNRPHTTAHHKLHLHLHLHWHLHLSVHFITTKCAGPELWPKNIKNTF